MHAYKIDFGRAALAAVAILLGSSLALYTHVSAARVKSNTDTPGQRIFIDPDTGKVTQPGSNTPRAPDSQSQSPDQPKRRAQDRHRQGARAWKTDDGVQMLTPAPGDTPKTRVVRCPDGSLHMGESTQQPTQHGRAALCSASHD